MQDRVNKPDTDEALTNRARRERLALADEFATDVLGERPTLKLGEHKDPRHEETWDILRAAAREAGFTGRFFYRTARRSGGLRLWGVPRKQIPQIASALEKALFSRACGSVGAYVEARQRNGLPTVYVHIPSEE